MKYCSRFLFTIQPLFFFTIVFSQSTRLSTANEPAWISKQNIDYTKTSLDKSAADGYLDISYETQINLADQSRYFRRSKKIISQTGMQNGSEITVSFDPSYEQLIFHSIHIIRQGEIVNKLQLSKIKTIHQEEELANFIYNGRLNAVLILDDVRQGDIIEYSYTIKGFNPIFKNNYSAEYSLEYAVPVYQMYYKLIVPKDRKVNIKNLNETIQPVITNINGQQVYEWHKSNIAPLPLQDYAPSWYDPYAQILVSEFNNWKEVNDWAKELFPATKNLSVPVQKKIKEITTAYSTDGARIKAALRFVQDDIRYMGIEMGENSHKPADPSKVFSQRFGDCKEKSYLLCCMLRAMNIEANVVLINTDSKNKVIGLLPSPTDFDHATIRVKLDNIYYWFDPTIAYQRGDIKDLFYPDFQTGLVISDTTTCLTAIPYRDISYQHIKEDFEVRAMSGNGTLIVNTEFKGNDADDARSGFNNESIADIMTDNVKFYSRYYDDIKSDSLTYTDNDSTGIFTTTEYYSLPEFWTVKDSLKKFTFSAFNIDNILRRPKEKNRKMPFSLAFPTRYEEEITISLPDEWHVTNSESHLRNSGFSYNSKFFCESNQVHLITDYQSYKDNVTVDEAPAYFKDLNEYDEDNFVISLDSSVPKEEHTIASKGISATSVIIVIALVLGSIVLWTQRSNRASR